MHSRLVAAVAILVLAAVPAFAQAKPAAKQAGAPAAGVSWDDLKGDWIGHSYRADKSVITEMKTTFGEDKKIWVQFPGRPTEAGRLVAMAGDSVVVEVGPYKSITREGHMVTTRMTSHVKNHKMKGTFHAKFDDGQTLDGTSESAHKIK